MKKGQTVGYVEQLGTFVAVEVRVKHRRCSCPAQCRLTKARQLCNDLYQCQPWKLHCFAAATIATIETQPWVSISVMSTERPAAVPQSPQAGEIASFIADEGQPVEYGEDVVELAPFFGGARVAGGSWLFPILPTFIREEQGL